MIIPSILTFVICTIKIAYALNVRSSKGSLIVSKYFNYWNERDMQRAVDCFDESCEYEDTLYPTPFNGKSQLKAHLFNVAASLPKSFQFKIDDVSDDPSNGKVGIRWHVESNGRELPFTRGCSIYTVNNKGLISKGFDVPEPTLKTGSISLFILQVASKLIAEPIRVLPLLAWGFYCWFLFLSDVAPGVNALQLDPATWTMVRDLSLNFWLVLPIFSPETAPIVHPILEGVFNLLLAWAALFAGFAVDGRRSFGAKNDMVGTLAGMQLLTNAIFLPYLVTREAEADKSSVVYEAPLTPFEAAAESKLLPIVLGSIGAVACVWGVAGRPEFGDLPERGTTFIELLTHDRLTFSFVVDLVYFALFQGWLIDEDAQRRGGISSTAPIVAAKTIPFLGLLYYMLARPKLKIE